MHGRRGSARGWVWHPLADIRCRCAWCAQPRKSSKSLIWVVCSSESCLGGTCKGSKIAFWVTGVVAPAGARPSCLHACASACLYACSLPYFGLRLAGVGYSCNQFALGIRNPCFARTRVSYSQCEFRMGDKKPVFKFLIPHRNACWG